MSTALTSAHTYESIRDELHALPHRFLRPGHSTSTTLTARIAGLTLHPTLEAALHLLNSDLPSAHFLVRQMQAPPALEGMTLHGILHRIEGDFDNARAWYRNVADEKADVFRANWTSLDDALAFVDDLEAFAQKHQQHSPRNDETDPDYARLAQQSRNELDAVVDFCAAKFGTQPVPDASAAYAQPQDEHKQQIAKDMVTGNTGYRKF